MAQKKSLYDFLVEAELDQYHKQFLDDLKVTSLSQVKYVMEDDLLEIGMTKPEIRRLNKFFKKYYHPGALNKLKEILNLGQDESSVSSARTSTSAVSIETVSHVIDAESITLHGLIGEGEFGSIHHATWKGDFGIKAEVSVKTIKKSVLRSSMSQFTNLMIDFQQIRHENIVRLFGMVVSVEDKVMLVMELSHLKSLLTCLGGPSARSTYSVVLLSNFVLQVARAMEFLEMKHLVHRDLALRNVLVFDAETVKVSDAGLTRAIGVGPEYFQRNVCFNLKLPVAWCAPESIEHGEFTSFSDVWAFGVTVWEMFSYGFTPWAGFTGKQIASAVGPDGGFQRLDQPDSCPGDLYQLVCRCWKHEPEQRPKFSEIVATLNKVKLIRMQILTESRPMRSDCLSCKKDDVITVLENKPKNPPVDGMWKGVLESTGRVGFFDPTCAILFYETEHLPKSRLTRKYSSRRSFRHSDPPRLHSGMISSPQNDLRHVSHVGYDGAVFGDVSFIGQNYDRLPFKVRTPDRSDAELCLATRSVTMNDLHPDLTCFSNRSDSISTGTSCDLSPGSGVIVSPGSSLPFQHKGVVSFDLPVSSIPEHVPVENTTESQMDVDLEDFNVPDLSGSMELDMSILDEMMRSFGKFDDQEEADFSEHTVRHFNSEKQENILTSVILPQSENGFGDGGGGGDDDDDDLFGAKGQRRKQHGQPMQHQEQHRRSVSASKCESVRDEDPEIFGKRFSETERNFQIDDSTERGHAVDRKRGPYFELSDPRILVDATEDAANVDETTGGGGISVLAKIGGVLSRRSEIRLKRSLQTQIPSSSSSSAEILPSADRTHRYISRTVSASLPRDGSLHSSEDRAELLRPVSFLREGRSFSRTKAKIKSSVSSVLGGKTGGSSRREPAPNINVNLQFFDRLREQELEKVMQEESRLNEAKELEEKKCPAEKGNSPAEGHDLDGSGSKRGDYITRPLGLRLRNSDPAYDAQSDEGTQSSHFTSYLPPPLVFHLHDNHDSSRDSSHESSVTRQSDGGAFADDSELESPECRGFSPALLDFLPVSDIDPGHSLDVTRNNFLVTNEVESNDFDGDDDDRKARYSDRVDRYDYYEETLEAVLDDCFSSFSPHLEEVATPLLRLNDCVQSSKIYDGDPSTQLMKIDYLVQTEQLGSVEHCRAALMLCHWDLDAALLYLREHPVDQESPEYVHV